MAVHPVTYYESNFAPLLDIRAASLAVLQSCLCCAHKFMHQIIHVASSGNCSTRRRALFNVYCFMVLNSCDLILNNFEILRNIEVMSLLRPLRWSYPTASEEITLWIFEVTLVL